MKSPTPFTAVLFITVATTWLLGLTQADTCAAPLSQFVIEGEHITSLPFNSSQECCDKCLSYPDCKAYMYFGGYKAAPATCTFFRSITSAQYTTPYDLTYTTTYIAERSVPEVNAWGHCGDANGGYTPCVDGYYCMPWDSTNYQCIQKPDKCEVQTNFDYAGNDIKTLVGITPGDCCDECTKVTECAAYTFVNNDPDGKTKCYLKTSPAGATPKIGVFSGRVKKVNAWGKCGDKNGYNTCVDGYYCMPWDQNYYQCIQKPAKCTVETNIDYYGNDIKTVVGITPGDCCEQCSTTSGCKAYTFVNDDPDGKTKCYLKTSKAGRTAKTGVFSGTYP